MPDFDKAKEVSFGEGQVDTKRLICKNNSPHADSQRNYLLAEKRRSFTALDEPASKVLVQSMSSEVPNAINPPGLLDAIYEQNPQNHNTVESALAVELATPKRPAVLIADPPLPSLLASLMSNEQENPFRPCDELYNQVEPIVEAFRAKPYLVEGGEEEEEEEEEKDEKCCEREQGTVATVRGAHLDSAKAGRAQLVHVSAKKKKTDCCVLQ